MMYAVGVLFFLSLSALILILILKIIDSRTFFFSLLAIFPDYRL